MDEEDSLAIGRQYQAAAGNVTGSEVIAGERSGRTLEELEDEFEAFERLAVGGIVEFAGQGGDGLGVGHEMKKPPV